MMARLNPARRLRLAVMRLALRGHVSWFVALPLLRRMGGVA